MKSVWPENVFVSDRMRLTTSSSYLLSTLVDIQTIIGKKYKQPGGFGFPLLE